MASDDETQSPDTQECEDSFNLICLQQSQPDTTTPAKKKKSRRITKCHDLLAKRNTEKLQVIIDKYGNPQGIHKTKCASFMGVLIRTHVSINFRDWRLVPTNTKEFIWEELKATFDIKDADNHKDQFFTRMGNIFRGSKATHAKYVKYMNDKEPNNVFIIPKKYKDKISQAEWNEFVEVGTSQKWADISKQNAENKSKDEYRTYLGRGGYSKYKEDNDLQFAERHVLWRGVRRARNGVEVEVDDVSMYRDPQTFEVAKEIDNLLCKIDEGKEVLGEHEDVLQRVLKKKPHPARLLTGGMAATLKDKIPNKSTKCKIRALDEERGKRKAAEDELTLLRQQLDKERIKRKATKDELTSQRIRRSAECDTTIVALVVHVSKGCNTVGIGNCDNTIMDPVIHPSTGHNPSAIVGYTEPAQQIIIHSPEDRHNRYGPSNESYMTKFKAWLKKQKDKPKCTFVIPDECFGEGVLLQYLFINMLDINHFLSGGDMEKAWVAIYSVILYKRCQAEGTTHKYGFVDPNAITVDDLNVKQLGIEVQGDKLMKSMLAGYKKQKLIFVPWLFSRHWMLIVVIPDQNGAYWMDPYNNPPKEEAMVLIDNALRKFHKHHSGKPHQRKLHIKRVKVPQQKDVINCGYYVCRFTKTIIGRGWKSSDLSKQVFELEIDTYAPNHIDEIKEDVIRFFMTELISGDYFNRTAGVVM